MSPREAPSALFFFFRWALWSLQWWWRGGGLQLYAPRSLPSLITEDDTKSRKKGAKRRDKRYPRRRIRFNFTSFLLPAMFHFLPARVIALPTRREVGMQCRGRMGGGRCAGDVPFCFPICMGVSAEWQISGETHASSPQKVAVLQGVRGTSVAGRTQQIPHVDGGDARGSHSRSFNHTSRLRIVS